MGGEPKGSAGSLAAGLWVLELPLPQASGNLSQGPEAALQGLGGAGLSPRLQVVVELLRLGLQVLEFLLNEVSQGFPHLHS